jgi:hypothetical protein
LCGVAVDWNNEKYSERLSKRIHGGLDMVAQNGTFNGGLLIYGYKLVGTGRKGGKGEISKIEIDKNASKNVNFIFNEYSNGSSKKEICESLNRQGEHYRNGTNFHFRYFDTMLSNKKYLGEFSLGGRECPNMYPQIIDQKLFEKVQVRLKSNNHFSGTNSAIEPYLLTGKAFCFYCNAQMVAGGGTSKSGKKHHYYECKNHKIKQCHKKVENKNDLEKAVIDGIISFLSKPENVETIANDTITYFEDRTASENILSIERKISSINTQVDEMTTTYLNAPNPLLKKRIETRMNEIEITLSSLQAEQEKLLHEKKLKLTKNNIIDFIAEILGGV